MERRSITNSMYVLPFGSKITKRKVFSKLCNIRLDLINWKTGIVWIKEQTLKFNHLILKEETAEIYKGCEKKIYNMVEEIGIFQCKSCTYQT